MDFGSRSLTFTRLPIASARAIFTQAASSWNSRTSPAKRPSPKKPRRGTTVTANASRTLGMRLDSCAADDDCEKYVCVFILRSSCAKNLEVVYSRDDDRAMDGG